MTKPTYWPDPGNAAATVALLEREGVWHLGGYEGCLCTDLTVLGFKISVSCRKSSVTATGETLVTVICDHGFGDKIDVGPVEREVARQVKEAEPGTTVRFGQPG